MSTTSPTDFTCDCSEEARSACKGESFFKEHEGKRYCVLHYPAKDKISPFRNTLRSKLDNLDFNFNGVWFPEAANFENVHFSRVIDFRNTTFNAAANFGRASFGTVAKFDDAKFSTVCSFLEVSFLNRRP